MKRTNKWVMSYKRIREDGNSTREMMIVEAENFEEAKRIVDEFCDMQNSQHQNEQYKAWHEVGHQLVVGGGCRW